MDEDEQHSDVGGLPWLMSQEQLKEVIKGDRRRSGVSASLLGLAFLLMATVTAVSTVLPSWRAPRWAAAPALVVAAFCLLAAVIAPAVVLMLHRMRSRQWQRRQRECEELTTVVDEIQDKALGKLVSFNFRLMDRFTSIALSQARISYVACSVAGSAALLVLLVGTAAVMTAGTLGVQVTAGVLTAAGTALSGFLSVTFLRTFEMTSRQMSYYYGQPLVHCYLLHAEWLAERFGENAEPEFLASTRKDLIRAALEAGRHAQDHLLDLQRTGLPTSHPEAKTDVVMPHNSHVPETVKAR